VDRWVLRAMKRYFKSVKVLGAGEEAPNRAQYLKIVRKARKVFGDRCGLASEYLFLFLRLLDDEKLRRELAPYCQSPNGFFPPSGPPKAGANSPKNRTERAGNPL
jgi:hypothetical protein